MAPQGAVEGEDESTNKAKPSQELSLRTRRGATIPPLQPTTALEQVHRQPDGPCDLPVTPTAQLMLEPVTPMAPARNIRKRSQHQGQPNNDLGRHASPCRLPRTMASAEELISATTPTTATRLPQSTLKKQGLAVFSSSFKQNPQKSQGLVDMIERDSSLMDRLKCLIDRGRRFGGSPSYSFNQGRTRIRYVYLSAKDVEHQPVAETPRKKRGSGRRGRNWAKSEREK
ncbi:hypothetical protein DV736_g924, partial [Chaetothyriales sp. CBS 134916]